MDLSALGRAFSGGGVNPGGPDPNQNVSALSKIGAGLQGAARGFQGKPPIQQQQQDPSMISPQQARKQAGPTRPMPTPAAAAPTPPPMGLQDIMTPRNPLPTFVGQ